MILANDDYSHLIFLISQPRAGSTLVQKLLFSHPQIFTVSEPWLLLHPMFALRQEGVKTIYNHQWAKASLEEFIKNTGLCERDFFTSIRNGYGWLYNRALEKSGKKYFLDKTPRYYYILREISQSFPDAQKILLFRNPIAVICSIVTTWIYKYDYKGNLIKKKWKNMRKYKEDLLLAPFKMLDAQKYPNTVRIQYEDCLDDCSAELSRALSNTPISSEGYSFSINSLGEIRWNKGDQGKIHLGCVDINNSQRWVGKLSDPQLWRIAREYLSHLGEDVVNSMGYSYHELIDILEKSHPGNLRLILTKNINEIFA